MPQTQTEAFCQVLLTAFLLSTFICTNIKNPLGESIEFWLSPKFISSQRDRSLDRDMISNYGEQNEVVVAARRGGKLLSVTRYRPLLATGRY